MIHVMLCGGLIGVGIWVTVCPRRLKTVLSTSRRVSRQGRNWLNRRTRDRHLPDLAIMHRNAADMVVRKLVGSLFGVAIIIGILTLGVEFGIVVPFAGAAIATVLVTVVGFVLPDQLLRKSATKRRRNFLHAFSSYLDLTNVLLAGGAGTETALIAAADAGDGWAFDEVRHVLIRAQSARRSPWIELASLGQRFALPEIIEVAGSVQLAGEHGARIRSSLAAKADSLRYRQMGEIEAQAQASTERMGIPMVMLFISFIALIGYPAVTTVVGGL